MATHRGFPACDDLAAWCAAFEKKIGREPRIFQMVGDAPASASFHEGGGSVDYEPLTEDELRVARNMGGAAWNRWWRNPDGSTNFHCHIRINGCPHNSVAQPQVEDLNEGRDGTGPLYDNAGTPDNGPRDGVKWPLRTWREGIEWAELGEDMPLNAEDKKWMADMVETKVDSAIKEAVAPINAKITRLNKTVVNQVTSVRRKLDGPIDDLTELKAEVDEILAGLGE